MLYYRAGDTELHREIRNIRAEFFKLSCKHIEISQMHQNTFRFHCYKKCSMNFGHTSSVIALCVKLVLLTLEMVRSSVDKAEIMEGEKPFVFPSISCF